MTVLNKPKQMHMSLSEVIIVLPCHIGTWLAVWLIGNALASINVHVVALRQTRLVPGWVTVYGRVPHLST